ncbi:MAG: protein-export rane protein SecD/SecF family [Candidatus Peribacteria bacterium]|nr:protein-export rane protein SecD/SecF family [Candidatus Peribacteria bacterium]
MTFSFIRTARYLLVLSIILTAASFIVFFKPGPVLSIDFTGGTLQELQIPATKTKADLEKAIKSFPHQPPLEQGLSIAETKEHTFIVRSRTLTNEEHTSLLAHLNKELGKTTQLRFSTIGPSVSDKLKSHSLLALLAASIFIIVYLALAFRKVPNKMSPWKFGVSAVAALLHDLIITTGIFTILSHTTSFQMDTLFVTALLSVMGYSVMDTIVIFDRIRDNLADRQKGKDLATLADDSLKQTLGRTINTVICALIMLFSLFFLGSESIRWFILALITGTIIGTYSSFFIATPLLVYWSKKKT